MVYNEVHLVQKPKASKTRKIPIVRLLLKRNTDRFYVFSKNKITFLVMVECGNKLAKSIQNDRRMPESSF